MPRMSGVPYHQNVYDLLDLPPGRWAEAEAMIAAHEAAFGPLPAALREWLTVPNVLPLSFPDPGNWQTRFPLRHGTIWYEYSNEDQVYSIEEILGHFAEPETSPSGRFSAIQGENQGVVTWWIELTGADDPPVWVDNDRPDDPAEWTRVADTFSGFVWEWLAYYHAQSFTPVSRMDRLDRTPRSDVPPKPHTEGSWVCSPPAPYPFPVLDDLTERFGDPEILIVTDGTTRHTFRTPDGTIRATADDPGHAEPLAAWWVYSPTVAGFERLTAVLKPWGVLGDSPRTTPSGDPNPLWGHLDE